MAIRESATASLAKLGVYITASDEPVNASGQKVLQFARPSARDEGATPSAPAPEREKGAKTPRAPRQGGISAEIIAHLKDHPGETFTASGIWRATHPDGSGSSGAFDAAAKRMAERGELVVASESPRKYGLPLAATANGSK